ncbi:MAG: ABC-type nitrate/sulfonate/bicarbonate transport system, permease component [Rhizobacter sp.]|nr:ABC-type nitrate/sulfonate/bicarbonate transport system, permease component [Rhizobacter sp.]
MTRKSDPLWRRAAVELALPLVLFVAVLVVSAIWSNFYFPPLAEVLKRFDTLWLGHRFESDVLPSLARLVGGYAIACIAGVGIGVPIGMFRPLRQAAEPVLEFFRAIPPPALIPVLVMLAGFGDTMKVAVIATGSIWPILLNTVEGVKGADSVLDETCRTYQIKGAGRLWHFVLPSAMPQIIVGMRVGLSIGIILMVISEMFAATNGLGAAIIVFQRSFEIPEMWSGVLMLGLFGFVLSALFRLFERRVLGWYYGLRDLERRS